MGVVFFVGALFALMLGGAGLLILCLILRAALKKRARAGGRWARRIRKLAVVGIVLGANALILPLIFFGFALKMSATPPDDFVDTGIVIEEEGYQLEEFTADGVLYQRLLFNAASEHGEAVFTYKQGGWYTASQWGNYFRVENGVGCDLVSDRHGGLFCPKDQYDRVVQAYESARETDSIWYVNLTQRIEVSDELRAAFRAVQNLESEGRLMEHSEYENLRFLNINEYSFDDVIYYGGFDLFYLPDGVFLRRNVVGQDGFPDNYIVPIPEEYQSALLELKAYLPFP